MHRKTKKMKEFKERLRLNSELFIGQMEKAKMDECDEFFDKLADILGDRYEILPSCNKDLSRYLVPKGTGDQVTYYGKPEFSFRVSDHWNWYSNLEKCSDERYIQCYSMDMPSPRPRPAPGVGTNAINGYQVAIQLHGRYHHVFGDRYNRKIRRWEYVDYTDPEQIARTYGLI